MKKLFSLLAIIAVISLCEQTTLTQNVNVSGALVGNGTYATLSAAFTAINGGLQTGANILVSIDNNTVETSTAALNAGTWASLNISPSGIYSISGSIVGAIIKLNGADNVTIDGRILGSGRNLTVQNTNTSASTAAIWLSSLGAGAGCTNNIIRNLEILCGTNPVTSANATYGIIMCGTTISTTSNGDDNDNNTFTENRIIKCRYGIVTRGVTTNNNQNIIVSGNIIGPSSFGTDEIGKVGIFMQADNNSQVINNTVQYVGGTFANTSAGADRVGIGIGQESWSSTTTSTLTSGNYIVSGNTIHDIVEERTFSAVGIIIGTTLGGPKTNNLISNNIIYNVKSNGTSGDQGAGIGHCGGPGDKIVFNSILMTGDTDPSGTTSASSNPLNIGISKHSASSADTAVTIKNNIVSMDLNSNTTTLLFLCIQTPVSPYSWGSGGMNNNLYYFPTSNTQMRTGATGTGTTTVYTTLANWQTAYSPSQDVASINTNPPFISSTNLHIDPLVSTGIESGGTPISGVTADIDGDIRNVSTPDIGADEGNFTPLSNMVYVSSTTTQNNTNGLGLGNTNAEIIGIQIVMSGASNPVNLTSLALNTNGSTNPATDITNAKVWYTGTSSTFAAVNQFGSTFSAPNGAFTVNGSQTLADGTNYFWVTYDISGSAVSGDFVDAECNSITGSGTLGTQTPTVQAPAGSRQILGPLSGTYTVGLSMMRVLTGKDINYVQQKRKVKKSIHTASNIPVNKVKNHNLSESELNNISCNDKEITNLPLRVIETEEEYFELYENGKIYDGPLYTEYQKDSPNKYNSGGDLLGNYATITAAIADLNLRGVSGPVTFLLIDGNYPGETYPIQFNNNINGISGTNNVTLKPQTGVTATIPGNINSNAVFRILSNFVTIDGSNSGGTDRSLTIQNNSITTPSVILAGSTGTTPITNITIKNCTITNGVNTSSAIVVSDATTIGNAGYLNTITIQNNLIEKAYNGIFINGGTTTPNGANVFITGNSLNSSGTNAIGFTGIAVQGVNTGIIRQNTIANFDGTGSQDDKGIWLAQGSSNFIIDKNNISALNYTGTSGYGGHGIYITTVLSNANVTIKNNMIYNITGDGWNYTSIPTDNPIGIAIGSATASVQSGINIYNNSIYLSGNTLNQTSALSTGVLIGNSVTNVDMRNNIIVNNLGLLGATGTGSTCLFLWSSSTQLSTSSYNCYYSNATGSGTKNIGNILSTFQTTIAGWRTATGKELQSFNRLPSFVSSTDLHIVPTNLSVSGRGNYIAGNTDDYDGDTRPVSQSTSVKPVDVGCDQYSVSPSPNGNICVLSGSTYFDGGLNAVEIVSGAFTTSEVRQYTGVQTPNNTFGKLKIPGLKHKKVNRDGSSGAETDAAAVNTPWIYWELDNISITTDPLVLRFYYNDDQLATIPEASLKLSYWDGTTWDNAFPQTLNQANNYIELTFPGGFGWPSTSLFAIEDASSPLPVNIENFDISVQKRDAVLNWTTSYELNNKGFAVERRINTGTDYSTWKEISFINGNGTSNERHIYQYKDVKLNSGAYQYRLKQVDFNNNIEYFSPVNNSDIIIGKPGVFDISQNYPNPSNPKSKIDFALPFDGIVSIKVYDILGREIASLINEFKTADFYTVEFDGTNIASGTYFYRIIAESNNQKFTKTLKMILVK